MGLRDILSGRTKQAVPQFDNFFALPAAAVTLQVDLDLVASGQGGLCFKAGSGERTLSSMKDMRDLLNLDESDESYSLTTDDLGFTWVKVSDPTIDGLVTKIHGANLSLVDHELGPRLLCAVIGFVPQTPPGEGSLRMVYLIKQGTFYPFAQNGPQSRDNELELRVRSFLETDLSIEKDLSKWMALWDVPVS